jgi:hypothetical protein
MRSIAIAALLALSASIVTNAQASEIGMGALMIWPTARSTALAGAMTGLADEADAMYFNPGGLAFQTAAKANLNHGNWLPGLWPGMHYASAAGGAPVYLPLLHGHNAFIAGSLVYMTTGETDIVNERGEFIGRMNMWRGAAAAHASMVVTSRLGVGVGLKLVHSRYSGWNGWWGEPQIGPWDPVLGLERGGTATTCAADFALLYRPASRFSIGTAVVNLGPHIVYEPSGEVADLPRTARLGLCWIPLGNRFVRLSVMPELTKVLVGMFSDTTGKSFGRQLTEEWKDVWKAVGVEATAFSIVSFRLGYFEDLTNQRGGIIIENEGQTYHYGIWDALTRRHLGVCRRTHFDRARSRRFWSGKELASVVSGSSAANC